MYDVDRDGRLSKEDVQEILKMMVGERQINEFDDRCLNA